MLLSLFGVVFSILFVLNNLLKTLFKRQRIGFLDLLLAFLSALLFVVALVLAELGDGREPLITTMMMVAGAVMLVVSLLLLIPEARREQKLRGSRGLLGLGVAVLVLITTFTLPFTASFFEIAAPAPVVAAVSPTPQAADAQADVDPRAAALFSAIRDVILAEVDLPEDEVLARLEMGETLNSIVTSAGGEIETIVSHIATIMREQIQKALAAGEINRFQAAVADSQMENFVRFAVNTDLTRLRDQAAERGQLALDAVSATPTPTQTATATPRPSQTPSPTVTRTPWPTATAAATRWSYQSPTPLPTSTPVTPCLAVVNYNLRLRAEPDRDAETLTVIPYATTLLLYASARERAWWQTEYEGQSGWIDGEFVTLGPNCEALPQAR